MAKAVLDASALIAWLHGERGQEVVAAALPTAAISSVNLAEVASVLVDTGRSIEAVRSVLADLDLDGAPFDDEAAFAAAALRPLTRSAGLSFGDRACLALAQRLRLPVLTADRNWASLSLGVEVVLIR